MNDHLAPRSRSPDHFPQRIVCLTEEPTEVLYALGEEHRIVGISGFTVRPPRARKEKPKVSAFTSAKIGEILKLEPDLAIGFSDIQADIARELIKAGVEVWISNHRSVDGILDYIRRLGAMVGAHEKAEAYAQRAERHIADVARRRRAVAAAAARLFRGVGRAADHRHPLGRRDHRHRRRRRLLPRTRARAAGASSASCRTATKWCGVRRTSSSAPGAARSFRPEKVAARPGWDAIPAVRDGDLHEIKSPIILQPGPAALFDGLDAIHRIIAEWAMR